jgi:hypothetical protein
MFTVGPELLDHIGDLVDMPDVAAGPIQIRSARAVNSMTWEVGYLDSEGKDTTATASTGATCWVVAG